jgi:preprotein translocase subunit SecD
MSNRYPLWKNALLIFLLFLGLIYASPNLFGDDPAIQISGKHGTPVSEDTLKSIKQILDKDGMVVRKIDLSKQNILVRFQDTDTQLKAQDVIKNILGDNYNVALNLAPATPAWLNAIGAIPVKLGLDLRGGVHFLLDVDIDSVLAHHQEGNVSSLMTSLHEKNIRYTDINFVPKDNTILLSFRESNQQNAAMTYLPSQFPDLSFTETDPLHLNAAFKPASLQNIRQAALDQTMMTLRNRVNELGVSEAIVQQQGSDRVSVDLPGIQDTAYAKEILGGTATLEFHLQDISNDPSAAKNTGINPIGSTLYSSDDGPVLLKNQVVLTGNSITDAFASFDSETGKPDVVIRLGGGGERLFHHITAQNVGKPMATVYIETNSETQTINGKKVKIQKKTAHVINTAIINSALGNNFQITGLAQQESRNLALLLRAGALPAAINYEEERTVGPTLGQENIHKGILSIEAALIIVIIFMATYYRLFGFIADIALLSNLILLVALLSILGATLTLPGIAGIVLTLGMAVDANVLIFERIREELRNGATPQASIYAGYERALVTIVDANITTLIVAMVLFGIGTDAVKGFAVTLTLGILTSMLTAVMFTRALVNYIYGSKSHLKQISIGI